MTYLRQTLIRFFCGILLLSAISANVRAEDQSKDFATLIGDSSIVYWTIGSISQYEGTVLTVSLPGGAVSHQTFNSAEDPYLEGPLTDGSYKYELVVIPYIDPAVRAEMKAARQAAGGQEADSKVAELRAQGKLPKGRQAQSGSFTVQGGVLMLGAEVEEE